MRFTVLFNTVEFHNKSPRDFEISVRVKENWSYGLHNSIMEGWRGTNLFWDKDNSSYNMSITNVTTIHDNEIEVGNWLAHSNRYE